MEPWERPTSEMEEVDSCVGSLELKVVVEFPEVADGRVDGVSHFQLLDAIEFEVGEVRSVKYLDRGRFMVWASSREQWESFLRWKNGERLFGVEYDDDDVG